MNFNNKVYEIVSQIPKGKAATYGQIALMAGNWRASRAVGYAMYNAPPCRDIPCHRVVYKDGRLAKGNAFGGSDVQLERLKAEGIGFTSDGRVDMKKYYWEGLRTLKQASSETCDYVKDITC